LLLAFQIAACLKLTGIVVTDQKSLRSVQEVHAVLAGGMN